MLLAIEGDVPGEVATGARWVYAVVAVVLVLCLRASPALLAVHGPPRVLHCIGDKRYYKIQCQTYVEDFLYNRPLDKNTGTHIVGFWTVSYSIQHNNIKKKRL